MTPERFRALGETRFGTRWKGKMARSLRVDKRMVQRWASGKAAIPVGVIAELARG